jgi:hypothetical protein
MYKNNVTHANIFARVAFYLIIIIGMIQIMTSLKVTQLMFYVHLMFTRKKKAPTKKLVSV